MPFSRHAVAVIYPEQMQPTRPEVSTCPNCGGVLQETSGGVGGCMVCLLQAGIGTEQEVAQDSCPRC